MMELHYLIPLTIVRHSFFFAIVIAHHEVLLAAFLTSSTENTFPQFGHIIAFMLSCFKSLFRYQLPLLAPNQLRNSGQGLQVRLVHVGTPFADGYGRDAKLFCQPLAGLLVLHKNHFQSV